MHPLVRQLACAVSEGDFTAVLALWDLHEDGVLSRLPPVWTIADPPEENSRLPYYAPYYPGEGESLMDDWELYEVPGRWITVTNNPLFHYCLRVDRIRSRLTRTFSRQEVG